MSNALAKNDFSKDQVEIIRRQFFPPNASEQEMSYCMAVAREIQMSPLTKEIFFVPRRQRDAKGQWIEKIEPLVSRDGLLNLANRQGVLAGMKTEVEVKDIPVLENGTWTTKPDLVATCTLWARGCEHPIVTTAYFSEHVQRTSDGRMTKFWNDMKLLMISKVAEARALRRIVGVSGVYCPEELPVGMVNDSGELLLDVVDVEDEPAKAAPKRSRLAVVAPPAATADASSAPEEVWPESEPSTSAPAPTGNGNIADECGIGDIVSLLESRNIAYEIDPTAGTISARSYGEREMLKSSGFKWAPESKAWVYHFEPIPF